MHLHYLLFVLCSIAPLLTHHPTIHHCTELSQGMAFFSGCGRGGSGGSWGICDIVCWRNSEECFPLCPSSSCMPRHPHPSKDFAIATGSCVKLFHVETKVYQNRVICRGTGETLAFFF